MSPDRWEQVEALFGSALERPPEHRAAYLAAATGDADAKGEARSLLLAHEARGRFDNIVAHLCGLDPTAMSPHFFERLLVEQLRSLRAALGERYTIERELGRGGMATVYLAADAKHHRSVAVKVLRPDLATSLGSERFRREIALAAKLQHPHILSVHDSGETASGVLWFTMPLIEGESLRDCMRRQRQLPIDEALRITREVALALDYAHRHGVIHRDIKPENILLVDGQAMVADFGIARPTAPGAPGETLPATGMASGTPAYMSPEQAAGARDVTAATDIFSLGVVLYEMLAGEPPDTEPTAPAVAAKAMAGDPPSVQCTRPTVPVGVDVALRKALAPIPADRFASAALFASALDTAERTATAPVPAAPEPTVAPDLTAGMAAVKLVPPTIPPAQARRRLRARAVVLGLGLLVVAGFLFAWRRHERSVSATSGPIRLAVLPFENLGDSADAYFADGITDAVRGKLTAVPGLEIIGPASSLQYRKTTKSPQQIGSELGVRYLLTGRVRWSKAAGMVNRVQVDPALVDATTAADKWEAPFDAPLTDVFQIQAEIAGRVAHALQLALTPEAQQMLAEQPTHDLEAYNAYLRGQALEQNGGIPRVEQRAAAQYAEAVRRDPSFALAWVALAEAHRQASLNNLTPDAIDDAEAARAAAERALALAPDLPEAHAALGEYDIQVLGDSARGLAEYVAAVRLSHDNARRLEYAGWVDGQRGQHDSLLAHREAAAQLDPRNANAWVNVCLTYLLARFHRYTDAELACDRAMALEPTNMDLVGVRMDVSLAQGNLAGARAVLRAVPTSLDPRYVVAYVAQYGGLGWVLDSAQERLLLDPASAAVGLGLSGDRGGWMLTLAHQYGYAKAYGYRGDTARAQAYADSARLAFAIQLRAVAHQARRLPRLALIGLHSNYMISLGDLGRSDSAIAEAKWVEAASPDWYGNFWSCASDRARVYLRAGEPDLALAILERGQTQNSLWGFSCAPGWLRIDPNFASLRGNPRFERLLAAPTAPVARTG